MDNNKIKVICIIGNKRVGKDTFYNEFKKVVGGSNIHQYSIAEPLKQIAKILFDFNEKQLYGNERDIIDERWGISARMFLQRFGTDIFQFDIYKYFPELIDKIPERQFWIIKCYNTILKKIADLREHDLIDNQYIVITDVRHKHEYNKLKLLPNSIFIKITRNTGLVDNHITENETNEIDFNYLIENNGTLDEYIETVHNFINQCIIPS